MIVHWLLLTITFTMLYLMHSTTKLINNIIISASYIPITSFEQHAYRLLHLLHLWLLFQFFQFSSQTHQPIHETNILSWENHTRSNKIWNIFSNFSGVDGDEVSVFAITNPPHIPRRVPCRVGSTRVRRPAVTGRSNTGFTWNLKMKR